MGLLKLVHLQSATGKKNENQEVHFNPPFVLWSGYLKYPQEGVCV